MTRFPHSDFDDLTGAPVFISLMADDGPGDEDDEDEDEDFDEEEDDEDEEG